MPTPKCLVYPMREANNGTNCRNNENSSVKTMFLTMKRGGGEKEGGDKWVDITSQSSLKETKNVNSIKETTYTGEMRDLKK